MHHYVWYNVIRDVGVSMAAKRYLEVNKIIPIFIDQALLFAFLLFLD
jgi:hypothetical protein